MADSEDNDFSNQREANEAENPLEAIEEVSNILSEHITTSNLHIAELNDRLAEVLDRVDSLQTEVLDLRQKLKTGGFGQGDVPDEDVSDIEDDDDGGNSPWMQNFRSLRAYTIEHGHPGISQKENPKLHKWIGNQKCKYSNTIFGKNGSKLTTKHIHKLESLGISWGKKFGPPKSWDEMYQELLDFKERMGNCRVPIHEANPSPLAKWVCFQRMEFKRYKYGRPHLIRPDQIDKLREIGFPWKGPTL